MLIIQHIKANKGVMDYAQLVTDIYGEDTPALRQRLYSAIDAMKRNNQIIAREDGKFELPKKRENA